MKITEKFKQWRLGRKIERSEGTGYSLGGPARIDDEHFTVSREQYRIDLQEAYNVGYGVGKADGLATAKRAAIKSLQEMSK